MRLLKTGLSLILLLVGLTGCTTLRGPARPDGMQWAQRMANSDMQRNKEAWQTDFQKAPKWNYVTGLVLTSQLAMWHATGDAKYYDYVAKYADLMVDANGNIQGYRPEEDQLDAINCGKILFDVYAKTKDEKYRKAIELLREQLRKQPRTPEGGFWHKRVYTQQMWLDGLYMGSPFLSRYAREFNDSAAFDDVALQFVLMEKKARDPNTGLLFHAWDSSHKLFWANPDTGLSANFWSRAMGWYAMGLVDALDDFPKDHPGRQQLIDILNRLAIALVKYQDPATGTWWQVTDCGSKAGNYREATASSMFVYALAKGVNRGYLPRSYQAAANKGFEGILKTFITEDADDKEIHLQQCCAVAGLGPDNNRRRNGSFAYYISEPIRADDGKGIGPFILASIELSK